MEYCGGGSLSDLMMKGAFDSEGRRDSVRYIGSADGTGVPA